GTGEHGARARRARRAPRGRDDRDRGSSDRHSSLVRRRGPPYPPGVRDATAARNTTTSALEVVTGGPAAPGGGSSTHAPARVPALEVSPRPWNSDIGRGRRAWHPCY